MVAEIGGQEEVWAEINDRTEACQTDSCFCLPDSQVKHLVAVLAVSSPDTAQKKGWEEVRTNVVLVLNISTQDI